MLKLRKVEKGNYFPDAFVVSFRYSPDTVEKIKRLRNRRYLPEERAWEIPANELVNLVGIFGEESIDIDSKYLRQIVRKEAGAAADTALEVRKRLEGIKPVIPFEFKTTPYPHQIEAFNIGYKSYDLLLCGCNQLSGLSGMNGLFTHGTLVRNTLSC